MRGPDELDPLRIYYTDPLTEAPRDAVHNAATRGFSHIMVPPPWQCGPRGDRFAPASLTETDTGLPPEAALRPLCDLAGAAGLRVLLDVAIDRVAAGAPVADAAVFQAPDLTSLLDPRRGTDASASSARLGNAAEATSLGAWWGTHMQRWRAEGAAGFRLLGLAACPADALPALMRPLRAAADAAMLLAWTPGMTPAQTQALRDTGLDGVFGSLPWWDFQAPWLWEENARLASVAPLIGAAAAPFGPVSGGKIGNMLAALMGAGWMATAANADDAAACNAMLTQTRPHKLAGLPVPLSSPGAKVLAVLRADTADTRQAARAALMLLNTDMAQARPADPAQFLPATGGAFAGFVPMPPRDGAPLSPTEPVLIPPGETRVYAADAACPPIETAPLSPAAAKSAAATGRLAIEAVTPCVDGGSYAVKRSAGERVRVQADVIFDGHDKIGVALQWRSPGATAWQETAMQDGGNDRWHADFPLQGLGRHQYRVVAWRDNFASFRDEVTKKHLAGVDVTLECREGAALVAAAALRGTGGLKTRLEEIDAALAHATDDVRRQTLLSEPVKLLMYQADDRPFKVHSATLPVDAERIGARFASWYEVFPRSLSDDAGRHGRFADVIRHLPRIRDMGFDVLYFPPIHPIGRINRKGPNNTLTPGPTDPGSPYAIGAAEGGHDALHPELGNFEDFQALRQAAAAHGLELALDFAVQCSPDHPWLKSHKGWFDWRPDGSIKYAENPPKKYQDIVNVDFYAADAVPDLWLELCGIVLFWAGQGVRLFRVDNPHTKPFPFWAWMIDEVRARYPDAIFLAEAFTRPKIMYRLAKIGFSQSYTYFTWRNTKRELEAYFTELADTAPRDFFRPHLFVNTPDINPVFLQTAGRPGFLIRAALATTLSGLWGVYNGFELCEAAALPGREEYLDSEKFQLRQWDWNRAGNIVAEITVLNRIRRQNPALQTHLGVRFLTARNDAILYFEKATEDRDNVILVAISLDPAQAQECDIEVPLWSWGLPDSAVVSAENLVFGTMATWYGKTQHVRLTPETPYMIWRVRPV